MQTNILDGLTILLVEEEPLIAMDIEQMCQEHGAAKVVTVTAPEKLAPEMLEAGEVDAAILDVSVAGGRTTELARQFVERGIPFVFATGYMEEEPFFAEFPGVAVVQKLYSGTQLVEALAAAITRRPSSSPARRSDPGQSRPPP